MKAKSETEIFYNLIKSIFSNGSRKEKLRIEKIEKMYDSLPAVNMNDRKNNTTKQKIMSNNDEILKRDKPIYAKPSLYAYYFLELKEIAIKYGYNLVLHGSLNRDLDLIAIPWQKEIKPHEDMIQEFAEYLGGYILIQDGEISAPFYHGRIIYVINIRRGEKSNDYQDPQYYLDISVTPAI